MWLLGRGQKSPAMWAEFTSSSGLSRLASRASSARSGPRRPPSVLQLAAQAPPRRRGADPSSDGRRGTDHARGDPRAIRGPAPKFGSRGQIGPCHQAQKGMMVLPELVDFYMLFRSEVTPPKWSSGWGPKCWGVRSSQTSSKGKELISALFSSERVFFEDMFVQAWCSQSQTLHGMPYVVLGVQCRYVPPGIRCRGH